MRPVVLVSSLCRSLDLFSLAFRWHGDTSLSLELMIADDISCLIYELDVFVDCAIAEKRSKSKPSNRLIQNLEPLNV